MNEMILDFSLIYLWESYSETVLMDILMSNQNIDFCVFMTSGNKYEYCIAQLFILERRIELLSCSL